MEHATLMSDMEVPAYEWHRKAQQEYYKKREQLEKEGKDPELALAPEPNELIERFERIRLDIGMTTTEFAKMIGEDMQQYYQWVNKRPPARADIISRLQRTLAKVEEVHGAV